MKKIIIAALAVGLVASAAQAQSNQVLSRNAVGYIKLDIQPGGKFTLVGDAFRNFDQSSRTLSNLFYLGNGLRASTVPANADSIVVWDPVSQSYRTFGMKTDGKIYSKANWSGSATNPVLSSSDSLFIQSRATATLVSNMYVMGEVSGATGLPVSIAGSLGTKPFSFVSNPYPVEKTLNELVNTAQGAIASAVPSTCDAINLWDEQNQVYVGLGLRLNGGGVGTNEWRLKSTWAVSPAVPYSVAPGKGFIYQRYSTGSALTFSVSRPYTWPAD